MQISDSISGQQQSADELRWLFNGGLTQGALSGGVFNRRGEDGNGRIERCTHVELQFSLLLVQQPRDTSRVALLSQLVASCRSCRSWQILRALLGVWSVTFDALLSLCDGSSFALTA
jgi:hypothetical protein